MTPDIIIVDIQGFKDLNNKFIIKEMAIATPCYTQTFLIKPPYSFNYLSSQEKKQVKWLERNRGIYWSEGHIDYREFKRIISPYLQHKTVLMKGGEKIKWLTELTPNCNPQDVGEKGCSNLLQLCNQYCKDYDFNCIFHTKHCALKNVLCIKKWYIENKNILEFN